MKFSNKAADLAKALCAIAIVLISVNACTEVDDQLGGNLLPNNQKMTLRIDTLKGVETYLHKQDSLVSSRLHTVYYGQESNPVFGGRKNGFIVQFVPWSLLPYDDGFGLNPIVDSMVLIMTLNTVSGDTTKVQNFDVYEITWNDTQDPISKDSVYYTTFPVRDYLGDKLFTFQHTGKRGVRAALKPTASGKDYLNSIITLDPKTYMDSVKFLEKYKGLYVTPADADQAAAVYSSSLAYNASCLLLYGRNHDEIDQSAIKDTVSAMFIFDEQIYSSTVSNKTVYSQSGTTSINIVDFNYDNSQLEPLFNKTEGEFIDAAQSKVYVQTMGGVTGKLKFTDQLINSLRGLLNDADGELYSDIMINQAEMYIWLENGTEDPDYVNVLESSMARLGSYLNLTTRNPIPDYQYYSEYQTRYGSTSSDPTYILPYNGMLNRSNGYYRLDITSYVQQLAKDADEGGEPAISSTFYLAPENYGFFSFGESTLKGYGSDKPIKIRITYTLIKGSGD